MAEPLQSKIGFGPRDSLSEAISSGRLDAYDIVCLDNQEFGWVDENGNPVISKSRTQESITVNGVNGLGIEDGKEIPAGKSLDEIIRMLVQKAIPATYTKPTVTLSASKAGTYEVGELITDTFTANFTQNDSQGLTKLAIIAPSGELVSSANSSVSSNPQEIRIIEGTSSYRAVADYQASITKNNNLGEESTENAFEAGQITAKKDYIGGWKTFYGAGSGELPQANTNTVRALEGTKLNAANGNSFSISLGIGDQWAVFAYPSNLRDVSEVMYVETNDTSMAANFTKSLVNVEGANGATGREYKVYTWSMATPAETGMTFKVII